MSKTDLDLINKNYNLVSRIVKKIKESINNSIQRKNYNNALKQIEICARILYETNLYYYDHDLEDDLIEIFNKLFKREEYLPNKDVVLFFNGFSDVTRRGLDENYLSALIKLKKIIYITPESRKDKIPYIVDILKDKDKAKIYYLKKESFLNQIKFFNTIIEQEKPYYLLVVTNPIDVVFPIVFYKYTDFVEKYLINITDHAFWLGKNFIDKIMEFRDYGAYISNKYRLFDKNKLICLPFYPPVINENQSFEGYPFKFDPNKQKLIFSGGSIYKTIGGNNYYYKIIDYILSKYEDVVFWYCGSGQPEYFKKFNDLKEKYPKRLFVTNERSDFFQIIKRCYFYLSTYPLAGGLLTQYVAQAGKLPITLKNDICIDGLLTNQDKLGIIFNDFDSLINEIDKLFQDKNYILKKQKLMNDTVISENEFEKQLKKILEEGKTDFSLDFKEVDTQNFRNQYLLRLSKSDIYKIIAHNYSLFKYLPYEYIAGRILRTIDKIKIKWDKFTKKV